MKKKGLCFVLIHIHGLFRSHDLELGRDADTGGQTKYVLEYATAISEQPGISRVIILNRYISDKRVSSDYSLVQEPITEKAEIVRIKCGGSRYIRKEKLWPYLNEFVDNTLNHLRKHDIHPDILHSHYADAGYVAMELSKFLNIPFIHTGHSLGIPKKNKLLESGMSEERINDLYRIDHRIKVENNIIERALFITTSTQDEISKQYALYKKGSSGTYFVNPPGIDLDQFYPYYYLEAKECLVLEKYDHYLQARARIKNELERFLLRPKNPLILSICRPETRKNIEGLITAYGLDKELQYIANLAIFAGIRKDITEKDKPENRILIDMLLLMDKYDLYGKMAIPKKHNFEYEVPELYRHAAELKGVFVNSAFHEPFGLTLLEAAASGLPIVSTDSGGPQDIVANCKNGLLVNVEDPQKISRAIKKVVTDTDLWTNFSNNGINNIKDHYSWSSHCRKLINRIQSKDAITIGLAVKKKQLSLKNKLHTYGKWLVTDLDNTLLGDTEKLNNFLDVFNKERSRLGFMIATGRNYDSAKKILDYNNVPKPDIWITSVGTEIYYHFTKSIMDKGWKSHIQRQWDPEKIKNVLEEVTYLVPQTDQGRFKISYFIHEYSLNKIQEIKHLLKEHKCHYSFVVTEQRLIDILPQRASKYKAIRYLCHKWSLDQNNVIVAGDAGNDKEMLQQFPKAVVVANHQPELTRLKKPYFSPKGYAEALLDGLYHYNFIST